MRIVFAVTNDLTYDRRMHRICTSLQKKGHLVTLVGRQLQDSRPLIAMPFDQQRIRCRINSGPLFYAEFNIRLFFRLLRADATTFGACDLDTALAVVVAGMYRRRTLVFDAHEHFTEVPEVERRPGIRRIWHTIGKWSIPRFHLRYTVGDELAKLLGGIYQAPFAVVRNMPRTTLQAMIPIAQREQLIVYVGALNEGRGIEQAIEAMQYLPEFRLKLIGEGDLSQKLRRDAWETGVSDRVVFAGLIAPAELTQEIAGAIIGLNVLEARSLSYYYSLSNKFFDYLHAGVPSISMAFPEYAALIAQFPVGITIDSLSADSLARAIRRISGDTSALQAMIDSCAHARTILCWEREEQHLAALFDTIPD